MGARFVSNDGLSVEYENSVADVLAYLAGADAEVERDVHLAGKDTLKSRQIDIVARGTIFGIANATLVVDCKRWAKKINVTHAGSFIQLVNDVRADFGFLITAKGASDGARAALENERGMRTSVMSLNELSGWRPRGTRSVSYLVQRDRADEGAAALRRAGFRVRLDSPNDLESGNAKLEAFRYFPPDLDELPDLFATMGSALLSVGIEPDVVGSGVVNSGGTPNHRYMMVTANGVETDYKVLAGDEAELADELSFMADIFKTWGVDMQEVQLDVIRPPGWPFAQRMFG